MVSEDLSIVRKVVSPARDFYAEGINGVSEALRTCIDSGFSPLFMPDLAFARTNVDKGHKLWQNWYLAPSVRVTGKTRKGNSVVVYAHVPTSLSDPANIRKLIDENSLVDGALPMENDEFYSLLEQEGNGRVFVVDYDKLRRSSSGVISVKKALKHTQTVPFLGGEQVARDYLAKHEKVYGGNIGVWHSDDLKDRPMGRVLFVGDNFNGLVGSNSFGYFSRFLGVAPTSAPLEQRVITLDEGRISVDGIVYRRE